MRIKMIADELIQRMRETLFNKLELRCVFSAYEDNNLEEEKVGEEVNMSVSLTARCMIEHQDQDRRKISKDFLDDIVARVLFFSDDHDPSRSKDDMTSDKASKKCERKENIMKAIKRLQELFGSDILVTQHDALTGVVSAVIDDNHLSSRAHPGICRVLKLMMSPKEVLLVHAYPKHTIKSISRFHASTTLSSGTLGNTSGLGCKDLRLRYIVFQILHAILYLHGKGLCLTKLDTGSIMLDDYMWVYLPIGLSGRVLRSLELAHSLSQSHDKEKDEAILATSTALSIPRPVDYYEPLTIQWISGKITNFEYLMAINLGAGRMMMDPLYHPLMPWVTDFTCRCLDSADNAGYRDLKMTKFRLSKGDTQLITTYSHSDPPHHVPESLSELTYYIYLARRTPLHILRRVVRDVFVPEHYPQTMHRIYEWTPDECIPEFFLDASVFESIHKKLGLPDLEFPSFVNSASEFIAYHRSVLESDYVSNKLHHWIDLTFGYCLDGPAAIRNMNVPLKHTLTSSTRIWLDTPNINKNPGFVMLFDRPHPPREVSNRRMTSHIYSYHNTRERSDSFTALNDLYHVNNSTKYSLQMNNVGQSYDDNMAIQSLVQTDLEEDELNGKEGEVSFYEAASKANRRTSATRDASILGNVGGNGGNNNNNAVNSSSSHTSINNTSILTGSGREVAASSDESSSRTLLGSSTITGSNRKSRKSLIRPPAEPSSHLLKTASPISLGGDQRCLDSLLNLTNQELHHQFVTRSNALLDGCYQFFNTCSSFTSSSSTSTHILDDEFVEVLESVGQMTENRIKNEQLSYDALVIQRAEDMMAIGCMIAELYIGDPLLSRNDCIRLSRSSIREVCALIERKASTVPLIIRRIITSLLQPYAPARPTAMEILKACTSSTESSDEVPSRSTKKVQTPLERSLVEDLKGSTFLEEVYPNVHSDEDNSWMISFERLELLSDYCDALFPAYFRTIYTLVASLKAAADGIVKMQVLQQNLHLLLTIPLDGLNLILFHILDVVGDTSAFQDYTQETYSSPRETSHSLSKARQILGEYWRIVDVVGMRVGLEGTEKLIAPQVHKFLNAFPSPLLLPDLISSPLWHVLSHRGGVKSFLRVFLPILLTYISAGVLQSIFIRERGNKRSDNPPLWVVTESSDRSEWLKSCSHNLLTVIQRSASKAVRQLVEPFSLGSGLSARYVLPGLLSLVGVPQLAMGGFERHEQEGISVAEADAKFDELTMPGRMPLSDEDRPNLGDISPQLKSDHDTLSSDIRGKDGLERYALYNSAFRAQDTYVVKSIVDMGTALGELVVRELILSTIFNVTMVDLEAQLSALPIKPGLAAAFMEVILLLTGLLPILSSSTIQECVLQPSRLSDCSLPKLLSVWPLSCGWCLLDDLVESIAELNTCDQWVEALRLQSVLLELCRLIVSTSMIAGVDACVEYVLPHVDIFFKNFVAVYGMLPVESKTMMRAFELGAELYLPLIQLVGAEAFYTLVPNVNPRLDLWLSSIGSHVPLKSPPLPSNIWPEVTTEVANQPERKKGFMSWISGRSKWIGSLGMSSLTSPTPPAHVNTSGATPIPSTSIANGGSTSTSNRPTYVVHSSPIAPNATRRPSGLQHTHQDDSITRPEKRGNPHANDTAVDRDEKPSVVPVASVDGAELIEIENDDVAIVLSGDSTPLHHKLPIPSVDSKVPRLLGKTLKEQLLEDDDDIPENDVISPSSNQSRNQQQISRSLNASQEEIDEDSDDEPRAIMTLDHSDLAENAVKPLVGDAHFNLDTVPGVNDGNCISLNQYQEVAHTKDEGDRFPQAIVVNLDSEVVEVQASQFVEEDMEAVGDEEVAAATIAPNDASQSITMNPNISNDAIIKNPSNVGRRSRDDSHIYPFRIYQKLLQSREKNLRSSSSLSHTIFNHRLRSITGGLSSNSGGPNSVYGGNNNNKPRKAKVSSILYNSEVETPEEVEYREYRCSEMAWLLAGSGRWNVDKEVKERTHKEQSKLLKGRGGMGRLGIGGGSPYFHTHTDWVPPAQMSMTAPRIAVDVANEAGSWLNFHFQSHTQWKLEEAPGQIRCMIANANESLLMTCSRTGVRIWSLNTHPLLHLSSYMNHASPPFNAAFLKDGLHAVTCAGSIHVWDIETRTALAMISANDRLGFSSMSVITPKYGIYPALNHTGDDQLLTTMQDSLSYYDLRCHSSRPINRVANWILPQIPPPQGNFISSTMEPLQLSCAASHENYAFAGSTAGGLWVVDRRMGRVLQSWQGHDGPIMKIHALNERHFLAVSDRSSAIWEYVLDQHNLSSLRNLISYNPISFHTYNDVQHYNREILNQLNPPTNNKDPQVPSFHTGLGSIGEFKRVAYIRSGLQSEVIGHASNIIISPCDLGNNLSASHHSSSSSSTSMMDGGGDAYAPSFGVLSKPSQYLLYCLCGHKMFSGVLPIIDGSALGRDAAVRNNTISGNATNNPEMDELKLSKHYFMDRKGVKLSRSKMQITSAVLLPLRRLMLLGTEDGLVRVIS